ncbi:MAG: HAMP domain-containing histidine kinase [Marinifilaceae bacterium]|nr:HAMP domain-containing histidine kinase [Marinifilaceae bacterium]
MKLLTKINKSYFKYGILVFLIADFVIIAMSNYFLKEEIDQQLRLEATEIFEVLKEKGKFQSIYPTDIVTPISSSEIRANSKKDTLILDLYQNELTPYREFTSYQSINEKHYRITTRQMLMEFDDILTIFTTLISSVLFLIFIGLLLFTHRLNTSLWKIFNDNVEKIKFYSLTPPSKLELTATGIDEFDALNQVLSMMSSRLEKDYTATKEFSANAAHEFQTPLAVIRNKCENLFSDSNLNENTIKTIREIYLSTDKLSGITKALLLLAKIDHGQFNERDQVSLNQIFNYWMSSFQDVIQDRNLLVTISAADNCQLLMDKRLANLLIQNIFVNAIKHSKNGEEISIYLAKDYFTITNSGEQAINQPEMIFNRFYTESQNIGSTGIGLAIVKKIADHYKINIDYSFKDFKHLFTFKLQNC